MVQLSLNSRPIVLRCKLLFSKRVNVMRNQLINQLNRALESDYNLVEHKLLKTTHAMKVPDQSGRFTGNITALSMLCDMLEIEQIHPTYENDIIQYFE